MNTIRWFATGLAGCAIADVPDHPTPYWGTANPLYEAPQAGMQSNGFTLQSQNIVLRIPLLPAAATASDTPLGPIGIAVNGVVLFNQYAGNRQPLGPEILSFDRYNGHPAPTLQYHYHFEPRGHESGRQQAWTEDGALYLNYEMRNGRRFGLVNAQPCVVTNDHGVELPYYTSAAFTPEWQPTPARRLQIDLRSQLGDRITGADLLGRPHVASFFFASCSTVCPALMRQLKRVQDATPIRLVSYSVTPQTDTPPVLAGFARRHGVDGSRWLLLTGDAPAIYGAARTFYFAGDSRQPDGAAFLHTEKVLLVDAQGRLRGIYDGTLPHDVDRLIADAALLMSITS